MRKNVSISKSLLRLFLLFISFIVMMVFIFLFRPEYFIDDIELIIKNKLSNSVDGELHIESINGNFIKGFKVKEIYYSKDSTILFSAKEIYMDPDLSRIALGTIAFSEVIVVSMFINFQSSLLTRMQHKKKTNISFFNTVIESLIIDNGLIFAMDHLYKLNGKIALDYSKVLEIDIYSLDIDSPAFQDVMVLDSGNLIYNNEEIKLSNAIIKSDWVAGTANIIVNIRDFQKSSANIQIDKFISEIINDLPINIKELSINIDSRHGILNGELQCDVEILNIKYSDIFISGIFSNNLIELNNASLIVDGQHIMSSGIINILEKSWEIKAIINEYKLTNSTLISGEINISSDFNLENYNGSILLNNSLIDSVDISSISGQYKYSNGILSSDKITVESVGQISNIIINSFSNIDNYDISGSINLQDFSNSSFISKYALDSLNGNINFSWNKNFDVNTVDLDVKLKNGLFNKAKYNGLNGYISGEIVNDDFRGSASGKLLEWDYHNYNWDTVSFNIDILKDKYSHYQLYANSVLGDNIYIFAEKNLEGHYFISECAGILKQNEFNIEPFYVNKRDDYYHFPKMLIKLGHSEIILKGNYQNNNNYKMSGNIQNFELNNLYSIIGRSYRIRGLITSARIDIENNNNLLNPVPIYFATIDMKSGTIDDIDFNKFNLTASYRHRRLLVSDFRLDTYLGNIIGDGWLNISIPNKMGLLQNEDKLNLNFSYENIDLDRFNRYFPWEYESRGLITGKLEIGGTARKPKIKSHIDISNPGFDKINADNISADIFYNENKLDFRNLSLKTNNGRFSGFGFLPLDLNLITNNSIDISKEPIDFVFTGTTNNVEFLPPYFDIVDSLTSTQSDFENYNSYSIELLITGSLDNPIRNGKVIIQNGNLYLDPIVGSIKNISGLLSIKNNQLIINNLTGLLDNKRENEILSLPIFSEITYLLDNWFTDKKVYNNLKVSGSVDLADFFNPKYALNLRGDNISILSSYDLFYGSGSADISITGQDTIYISGEFIPTPYNFTITNLDDDEDIDESQSYTKRIISYDIHIPIKDGIKVETDNVNILFDGDVNISKTGDEDYNFTGKANIIDGKFYDNQGNIYQNTYGNIILTPIDNTPYIDLHAQTKIEDNIIDVSFIGFTDNPSLIFDSQEYTQTEILQILTFGDVEGFRDPDQAGNMLSNYIENEIEKNITRYSALDEFQLSSQASLLDNIEGNEDMELKIIVGKQLSNKIYLNTELDLNDIENSQYEATYRINQNTSIVGGLDENNLWHLSYRIKFYYK